MRWPLSTVAVVEQSMAPALRPGDWLLVWRGLRSGRPPRVRPGQIVVARHPDRADFLLVKRAVRRAEGGWWLGSDNPGAGAVDSRSFGAVPGPLIRGRVLLRYRRGRAAREPAAGARTAEDPRPQERGGGPRTDG
ncbi:MAG TPA: S24 family peptidase [Streptosporangiaceae bacterium]